MKQLIQKLIQDESGASLIEYVLIGGIISIVGIGLMTTIGGDIKDIWTNIGKGTAAGKDSSDTATTGLGGAGGT